MTYLLDSNVLIAILNGRPPGVRDRLEGAAARGATIAVSAIVLFELWYGAAHSRRPRENQQLLQTFLSGDVTVVPFEEEDARRAGAVRAALEALGGPIGPYDVLIAGQALRIGATLVTANVSEFGRVPALVWEDWSR